MNHLPRTQATINVSDRDRLRLIERKSGGNHRPEAEEVAPFSAAGAVAVTTAGDEPEWHVRAGGQVTSATVRLKTAGSTSTVVTFYLNGASMGTVTLASGETSKQGYLGNYRVKNGDTIGARITTAGTGAKGLSAFVVMKG